MQPRVGNTGCKAAVRRTNSDTDKDVSGVAFDRQGPVRVLRNLLPLQPPNSVAKAVERACDSQKAMTFGVTKLGPNMKID